MPAAAPRWWPAAACALAVPLLALAAATGPVDALDRRGSNAAQAWPGSDRDWHDASWPGLSLAGAVVLIACAAGCALLRDGRAAALSLALLVVIPAVPLLKELVGRERPEGAEALADGMAFPSGHAAVAMAAYAAVALLLAPAALRRGAPAWTGPLAVGLWVGLAAGVGVARVAAGAHWPTDVLGGWAFGGAAAAAAWWANGVRVRATPRPATPPATPPAKPPA